MLPSIFEGFKVSYVFPLPELSSSIPVKFLAEHVTGHHRVLILNIPCWMEAAWLLTVLNMLEGVPYCSLMVKDLIRDVSVDQVLKGLASLHLTL